MLQKRLAFISFFFFGDAMATAKSYVCEWLLGEVEPLRIWGVYHPCFVDESMKAFLFALKKHFLRIFGIKCTNLPSVNPHLSRRRRASCY